MKKRLFLLTAVAGLAYVTLTSNTTGPAVGSAGNVTGAKGTPTSCGSGSCHGTTAGPTVTITVDSLTTSTAVTHYVPGKLYTIKIHGAGSSNSWFGFEFASVSGTGTSQAQAGTASSFPANVGADVFSGLSLVEQHLALAATSAGVYDVSFQWTAPTVGVGNITLYCTLNSVNHDGNQNAADVSGNVSVVLGQEAAPTAVASVAENMSINAYPNPAINSLNLQFDNTQPGTYTLQVFNLNGKCVATDNVEVNGMNSIKNINTANWVPGMYQVVVAKDGINKVIPVVKQ